MPRRRRQINIYHIAEEAGVSIATVSRVLNQRTGVTEEKRAKVDELLRKYEFKPDYPRPRQHQIAFITPFSEITNYIAKALSGVNHYCKSNGMQISMIMADFHENPSLLPLVRERQCSGAIILMPDVFGDAYRELSATELPVILLDTTAHSTNTGFIDNDSYSGSANAASYLLQLGHRKIAYLQHVLPSVNHIQRFKGYENTLKGAGIAIDPLWICQSPELASKEGYVQGLSGYYAMQKLLKQARDITAVMAVDDDMALGAMCAMHEQGIRIPEDISIVGFDNYPETSLWFPPLTTVNHPIAEAGYQAAEAIHHALKTHTAWTPPRDILPTSLVIRKSTGLLSKHS